MNLALPGAMRLVRWTRIVGVLGPCGVGPSSVAVFDLCVNLSVVCAVLTWPLSRAMMMWVLWKRLCCVCMKLFDSCVPVLSVMMTWPLLCVLMRTSDVVAKSLAYLLKLMVRLTLLSKCCVALLSVLCLTVFRNSAGMFRWR